jgi:hypothetical protein
MSGVNETAIAAQIEAALAAPDFGADPDDNGDRLTITRRPGDLIIERDIAETALAKDPSQFFRIGERIVAPAIITTVAYGREYPTPGLLAASEDMILAGLAERTRWHIGDKRSRRFVEKNPPRDIARLILAHGHASIFPHIAGVIAAPVPRPDGSIIDALGYDYDTRLFYLAERPLVMKAIPYQPTEEEADDAANDLLHLLSGFMFVDDVSRSAHYRCL